MNHLTLVRPEPLPPWTWQRGVEHLPPEFDQRTYLLELAFPGMPAIEGAYALGSRRTVRVLRARVEVVSYWVDGAGMALGDVVAWVAVEPPP